MKGLLRGFELGAMLDRLPEGCQEAPHGPIRVVSAKAEWHHSPWLGGNWSYRSMICHNGQHHVGLFHSDPVRLWEGCADSDYHWIGPTPCDCPEGLRLHPEELATEIGLNDLPWDVQTKFGLGYVLPRDLIVVSLRVHHEGTPYFRWYNGGRIVSPWMFAKTTCQPLPIGWGTYVQTTRYPGRIPMRLGWLVTYKVTNVNGRASFQLVEAERYDDFSGHYNFATREQLETLFPQK